MSEENMNIEQVEAEIVEEGKKAITLDDAPIAPEPPKPNFSENDKAGTAYEETASASSATVEPETKTLGIISLVLGILSIVCCCGCYLPAITGIAAFVLGIVSYKKEPAAKSLAIAGIICGAIGGVLGIVGIVLSAVAKSLGSYDVSEPFGFSEDFLDNLGIM